MPAKVISHITSLGVPKLPAEFCHNKLYLVVLKDRYLHSATYRNLETLLREWKHDEIEDILLVEII